MDFNKIKIKRDPDQDIQTRGCASYININGVSQFDFKTLELPWKNNERGKSCIPVGIYKCIKKDATIKIPYQHISIVDVKDRIGVCIHVGNYAAGKKVDIHGCIISCRNFKDINGDGNVDGVQSRDTFNVLMKILPDTFELEII